MVSPDNIPLTVSRLKSTICARFHKSKIPVYYIVAGGSVQFNTDTQLRAQALAHVILDTERWEHSNIDYITSSLRYRSKPVILYVLAR
jgi:hypothetical protein